MSKLPFLIAGGGIAGLSASLGLAKVGRESQIFEQATAFEEVGAGLQMAPNAVRALQAIGAWEAIEPQCVTPTEIHVRDGRSGGLLQRVRLGKPFEEKFGAPYRVAHRADLLSGLLTAARASNHVALHTASPVSGARNTADGAVLQLATGEEIPGAAIIGADGIHSVIRKLAFNATEAKPRGHTLYRALLPFAAVPPSITADVVTLWLLPGAHAVHYPVSAWRQFNIVVAVEQNWSGDTWSAPATFADFASHFDKASNELAELLSKPPSWQKWRGTSLDALPHWSNGNMVILGDAAHATLPYLAQGAAMAIEDAAILSTCISRSNLVSAALTEFQSIRLPRTSRVQYQSLALGGIYHARGAHRLARNMAMRLMPESHFINRLHWIYDWAP